MKHILTAVATLAMLTSAHAWQIQSGQAFAPYDPGDGRVLYGLRAMTAAAAATHHNAVRLRRDSDNAELDITVLSNGDLDITTADTFCNGTTCYATTVYDQSGNTDCNLSASPCDATQSVASQQPEFVFSCLGARPCLSFDPTVASCLTTATNARVQAQPFTYSAVVKVTFFTVSDLVFVQGSATGAGAVLREGSQPNAQIKSQDLAHVVSLAGALESGGVPIWVSWQGLFDGVNSVIRVNGAEATGDAGNGDITTGSFTIGDNSSCSGAGVILDWVETGYYPSLQDATARAAMEIFQRAYWGF